MRVIPLTETSRVVLDNDGNGTCPPIAPSASGETWNVSLISVQVSSNAKEAIASVYLNGLLIGTSTWGSTGDSDSSINQTVSNGQQISATWIGGDASATATMTVIGTRTVG